MNVNEIVSLFQVVYGNAEKSTQEKSTNAPGVGDRALLVNLPALQAVHLDATDPFLGAVARFPQCKDLDVMTFLRQGLGVTHHAVVGVIEGVRDHAHAQRLIEMAFRLPGRAGGQAVWFKQWYSDSGGFECGLGLGGNNVWIYVLALYRGSVAYRLGYGIQGTRQLRNLGAPRVGRVRLGQNHLGIGGGLVCAWAGRGSRNGILQFLVNQSGVGNSGAFTTFPLDLPGI